MKNRRGIFFENEKLRVILSALIVFGGFALLFLALSRHGIKGGESPLDRFAQCLSQKGVVMYGADWCPHCQNEKKAFGLSFRYVSYVECPLDPQRCLREGIEGYPTWIFPDGKRLVGEQGLENLSEESGCALEE